MKNHKEFKQQCQNEIESQAADNRLQSLTRDWFTEATKYNYSYHFEWLGLPIIQLPQDIIAMQQLIWDVKPDLIIETGIARGGSLIFYASILELVANCGGPINAKVLGVDINIRPDNKSAILSHPMSKRIVMIEGSSIDQSTLEQVKEKACGSKNIMICLDSNHTHEHVLQELRLYAPMVSLNSYIVVFDTVVEDLPNDSIKNRPWSKGNNPKTAVIEYLKELQDQNYIKENRESLMFNVDKQIEKRLLFTVAPSGYLKRV